MATVEPEALVESAPVSLAAFTGAITAVDGCVGCVDCCPTVLAAPTSAVVVLAGCVLFDAPDPDAVDPDAVDPVALFVAPVLAVVPLAEAPELPDATTAGIEGIETAGWAEEIALGELAAPVEAAGDAFTVCACEAPDCAPELSPLAALPVLPVAP